MFVCKYKEILSKKYFEMNFHCVFFLISHISGVILYYHEVIWSPLLSISIIISCNKGCKSQNQNGTTRGQIPTAKISIITYTSQWRMQRRGRGRGPRPPLFLNQNEAQPKNCFLKPPPLYLRVWMNAPPTPYLKVWIHQC